MVARMQVTYGLAIAVLATAKLATMLEKRIVIETLSVD